jgi:hypothetical protein
MKEGIGWMVIRGLQARCSGTTSKKCRFREYTSRSHAWPTTATTHAPTNDATVGLRKTRFVVRHSASTAPPRHHRQYLYNNFKMLHTSEGIKETSDDINAVLGRSWQLKVGVYAIACESLMRAQPSKTAPCLEGECPPWGTVFQEPLD